MKNNKNILQNYIAPIVIAALLVAFDQFTKLLAVTHLKNQDSIILIKGVFQLQYLENQGAAFGIMQNKQILFTVGAILILGVVAYFWQKMPFTSKYRPLRICSILIIAGAIGNMIDRIVHQYVVDFFYFYLINFPVFNMADIYVTVACFVFAYLILFYYKENELNF